MGKRYDLLHRDKQVAIVTYEEDKINIEKVLNEEGMPVGTYSNKLLNQWFQNRAVPKTRSNIRYILNKYGVDHNTDILMLGFAVSVSDCYWLKPVNEDLRWADVNLFDNDFEDITSELEIPQHKDSAHVMLSSSEGELSKVWFKDTV